MKIFFKIVTNLNYEYIQLIFLRYSLALHFATSLSEKNDKELGFFDVIQIFRWQPWQEYVQTIVECTGAPLEFFLEGTRSRSGKSLPPKIGTWTQTRLLQPWDVLRVQCWNCTIVNHSLYYFNTMSIFLTGLLGCVSECWLRGRLPDLAIVPISISYERTLEEKLYAYELLGVPKPKESTSVGISDL